MLVGCQCLTFMAFLTGHRLAHNQWIHFLIPRWWCLWWYNRQPGFQEYILHPWSDHPRMCQWSSRRYRPHNFRRFGVQGKRSEPTGNPLWAGRSVLLLPWWFQCVPASRPPACCGSGVDHVQAQPCQHCLYQALSGHNGWWITGCCGTFESLVNELNNLTYSVICCQSTDLAFHLSQEKVNIETVCPKKWLYRTAAGNLPYELLPLLNGRGAQVLDNERIISSGQITHHEISLW